MLLLTNWGTGEPFPDPSAELRVSSVNPEASTVGRPTLFGSTWPSSGTAGVFGPPPSLEVRKTLFLTALRNKGVKSPRDDVGRLRRSVRGTRDRGVFMLVLRPLRDCKKRSCFCAEGDMNEFSAEKFSRLKALLM